MNIPSDDERVRRWKENSIITPDGHWRYQGHKTKSGHGQVRFERRNMNISRAAAIIFLGMSRFSAYQALHKRSCPYPDCWNPDCLYLGDESQNRTDAHFMKRSR